MEFIWMALVFLGALAVRMAHSHWQSWAAWLGTAALGWLALWYILQGAAGATLAVAGVSLAGFLGPELWFVFRSWVRQLAHLSAVWIATAAVVVAMLYYPELLGPAATLLIMIFGLYIMIRGFRART